MGRKITDDVLIDYLNASISETDRLLVDAWLQDEHNLKYFQSLKVLWAMTALEIPAVTQTETAWAGIRQRIAEREHKAKRLWLRPRYYAHVAASLLLLIGICAWWTINNHPTYSPSTTSVIQVDAMSVEDKREVTSAIPIVAETAIVNPPDKRSMKNIAVSRSEKKLSENTPILAAAHSKEEICNSTNCPLEICILQSLEGDGKTTSFSHCSLLAPDGSGSLHYRSVNDTTEYCRAPVAEIRIKRVNTGETIVLNSETNVTAQEFFDYITGNKKGDIVAGIFDTDCNNHCIDQSIRIDNRLGIPMILQ